jgi:hypothetical protein
MDGRIIVYAVCTNYFNYPLLIALHFRQAFRTAPDVQSRHMVTVANRTRNGLQLRYRKYMPMLRCAAASADTYRSLASASTHYCGYKEPTRSNNERRGLSLASISLSSRRLHEVPRSIGLLALQLSCFKHCDKRVTYGTVLGSASSDPFIEISARRCVFER